VRIAIVSDAWLPQTNGVVTTLVATARELRRLGHVVRILSPVTLSCWPAPSYPEIRLALRPGPYVARELKAFRPQAIHIATEGPLGWAARRYCRSRRVPFTTSYHTRYPEYLAARWSIPREVTYGWLRRFHRAAVRTLVSSASLQRELAELGFGALHLWRRGVDLERFRPHGDPCRLLAGVPRPIMAYVGRLAVEKNLEAFLQLDVPGTPLLIGDGPRRGALMAAFPRARFAGYRFGDELAAMLAGADVLVFPSLTDTFGIAMIEALACGVPVAAFPVPGPLDVLESGVTGCMSPDLGEAIRAALRLDRSRCALAARAFTWEAATQQFLAGLAPIPLRARSRLAVGALSAIIRRRAGDIP
jgi:glycosyltransferase involved in cell wall biosynthesis